MVEQIHLAGTALHEQEYHPPRSGCEMRARHGRGGLLRQARQRHVSETTRGAAQKLSARVHHLYLQN
jgi:hypothetical protein